MENQYILSVWKNHETAKKWLFDICPTEQYFRNSCFYLIEYKQPYCYTAIYSGSLDACNRLATKLKELIAESESNDIEQSLKALFNFE